MRVLVGRPLLLLLLGLATTALALWPASKLSIETDPASFLPSGSTAAADYQLFLDRFGGLEKVLVLLAPGDPGEGGAPASGATLIAAADRLADYLRGRPEVGSVSSGLSESDLDFFKRYVALRSPLLLDSDWRASLERRIAPEAIRIRVARIKQQLLTRTGSAERFLLEVDPLGLVEELPGLEMGLGGIPMDLLSGGFLAEDRGAALVVLTPTHREIDPAGGRALELVLRAGFESVRRETPEALEFWSLGGPLYAVEDEALIKRDTRASLLGSIVGCAVLLVAAMGGFGLPLAGLLAVGAGLVWAAAGLQMIAGEVTVVSLGFSTVLLGLGVDYSIHGATRYREGLIRGLAPGAAMVSALRASGPGIVTSVLTTAGAFLVLSSAHLRPIRELGVVVAIGVVSILLASATVGVSLALLLGPRGVAGKPSRLWTWSGKAAGSMVGVAAGRPRLVVGLTIVATVLALAGLMKLELNPDLRVFRSVEHSSFAAEAEFAESFDLGLETSTIVVTDSELSGAMAKAGRVKRVVQSEFGSELRVSSASDWLVGSGAAEARLAELERLPLAEAADRFEVELEAAGLRKAIFAPGLLALREFGRGRDPGAPSSAEWPEWLSELVRESPQEVSAAVRVRAPAGSWPEGPPSELRDRVLEVAGGRVASASLVGADLRSLAEQDLRTLGGLALLVVVVVVLASFGGNWRHGLLALVPPLLGAVWAMGLWGAFGRPLDLATLVVLPIVLGVGLDDGLHVLHVYRQNSEHGLVGALREVSRAVVLTTATTCLAFGSLAWTSVPGLRSSGILVSLGVVGCMGATFIVLPLVESFGFGRASTR